MSFLRPEAVAQLRRWKEVIVMSVLLCFALWLVLRGFLADRFWLMAQGAVLTIVASVLLVFAVTKARLRGTGSAPGVVEIDEGRLTYWSDQVGGSVAISDIRRVSLVKRFGMTFWRIDTLAKERLEIPTSSQGGDRLVELLAILPGANVERVARALRDQGSQATLIWEKN